MKKENSPWKPKWKSELDPHSGVYRRIMVGGSCIAEVYDPRHAQLMASAPMLLEALIAARDHLEYCGYGDSWERECARDSGLPEKIEAAIEISGFSDK